jgi:hypothetical protein
MPAQKPAAAWTQVGDEQVAVDGGHEPSPFWLERAAPV